MKIITRGEAMRIHQQHPTSRLFPFCTGKYRWHGSAEAYTGREVQDIPGVQQTRPAHREYACAGSLLRGRLTSGVMTSCKFFNTSCCTMGCSC